MASERNAGPTTGNHPASVAADSRHASQEPIDAEELTPAIVYTLAGKYPGARIVSAYVIERAEGKLYRVVLSLPDNGSATLFLTPQGAIVKQ